MRAYLLNIASFLNRFFPEGRLKGILRTLYYRYIVKVGWIPSYDILKGVYKVRIKSLEFLFYDCPFFDLEHAVLDYLEAQPIEGCNVFVDAGSYIGTFGIYVARALPYSKVVALEPDPENFRKLINNIKLNELANITALNKGLWNKDTKVVFAPGGGEVSTVIFNSEDQDKKDKETISTLMTTLDDLCTQMSGKIDYVKMDIEGAEIEALEGAQECIKSHRPKMIIATYHLRDGVPTRYFVESYLKNFYRTVFSVEGKQLVTVASNH